MQLAIMAAVQGTIMAVQYFSARGKKTAPVDKGRFDDLRIQGSEYGTAIPIVIGKMRLAGNVAWAPTPPIRTVVTTTPGHGGKGSILSPKPPTPATNYYSYFTSLFVELCTGPNNQPIANGVRKIWAGADLIYNLDASNAGDDVTRAIDPGGSFPATLDDPRDYYKHVPPADGFGTRDILLQQ
jgi:hypothetical protein